MIILGCFGGCHHFFHYKPSNLGYPHFWKHPYNRKLRPCFLSWLNWDDFSTANGPGSSGAWRRYHFVLGHWCFWDCKQKSVDVRIEVDTCHIIWYHVYIYIDICIHVRMYIWTVCTLENECGTQQMEFWKRMFIFYWAIFRFHFNFQRFIIGGQIGKSNQLFYFAWMPQYGHVW